MSSFSLKNITGRISQRGKGIICIIFAAFGFSMMSVFVHLSGDLPSFQKAFFRNFVALIFVGFILIKNRNSFIPKAKNVPYLLGRCICGTLGIICNFYAIDKIMLADANMLNKLSPFFAVIFSIFLLKEKPTFVQIIGVLTALSGSVLIIKPTLSNPDILPSFIGLLGGLGAGVAYTFVRKLGTLGENGTRIIFWFSTFSCVFCLPFMIFNFAPMSALQTLYLVLAGVSACIGQFGITKAYMFAPAKEISVYDYTQVIFAAILGFFIFGQVPDLLSVFGYLLICGAGIGMYVYNRERDLKVTGKKGENHD